MSEHRSAARGSGGYQPLPAHVDLPAIDREIIDRWRANKVFQRSLDATAGGEAWTFYEGPPTANGMPGTHHVEARVFKDVFPRFKTMKGYHVARMAGWDCHGLPVELAVEKELGFTGKPDIEAFGIAEFNAAVPRVRAAPRRRLRGDERADGLLGRLRQRLLDDEPGLRRVGLVGAEDDLRPGPARRGLPGHAVLPAVRHRPVRPRARPQGLREVVDPSVYVRLPVTSGPWPAGPTCWSGRPRRGPWSPTPRSRCNPEVDLRRRPHRRRQLRGRRAAAGAGARRGLRGARPAAPAATSSAGTTSARSTCRDRRRALRRARRLRHHRGRHRAWCTRRRRSAPTTWRSAARTACRWSTRSAATATSADDLPLIGGVFFKDADEVLVGRPRSARGLLFRHVPYAHAYPHCWRCHTPLMYYALPSWYIRTTADQGPAARRERGDQLVPGDDQARPLRRLAATTTSTGRCRATGTGARRCRSGATTPTRPAGLRRLAGRAVASWPAAT